MNFEEVKQLVLESIDESNDMNELIQIVVNKIYQKGFNNAKKNDSTQTNTQNCVGCALKNEIKERIQWIMLVF